MNFLQTGSYVWDWIKSVLHAYIVRLFQTSDLLPMGDCMRWESSLMSLMIVSNLAIWFAYGWIAMHLTIIAFKKRHNNIVILDSTPVILFMIVFMVLGGQAYFTSTVMYFYPYYYIQASLNVATAFFHVLAASLIQQTFRVIEPSSEPEPV